MKGYIYKITNDVTNKSYIGFTETPEDRWNAHQRNNGSKLVFQAIKKYGLEHLTFEVIAEDLLENEDSYIVKYNTMYPNGYNLTEGGSRPPNHKGKTYEEIYGTERAVEQRRKRAMLQKERGGYGPEMHKPETREKIRKASAGKNNPMYGKKHGAETIRRMSEKKLGKGVGSANPNAAEWKLTDPTGKEYIIKGMLQAFCEEHDLKYATVRKSYELSRPMRNKWQIEKIG